MGMLCGTGTLLIFGLPALRSLRGSGAAGLDADIGADGAASIVGLPQKVQNKASLFICLPHFEQNISIYPFMIEYTEVYTLLSSRFFMISSPLLLRTKWKRYC